MAIDISNKFGINANHYLTGDKLIPLKDILEAYPVDKIQILWDRCSLTNLTNPLPSIELTTTGYGAFKLGQIGLTYLLYRLGKHIPKVLAMQYYRERKFVELNDLLTAAHTKFLNETPLFSSTPATTLIVLNNELLGMLTNYHSLLNKDILKGVAHLNETSFSFTITKEGTMLKGWRWSPLRLDLYLSIWHKKLRESTALNFGIKITNGETGHVAFRVSNAMWLSPFARKKQYFFEQKALGDSYTLFTSDRHSQTDPPLRYVSPDQHRFSLPLLASINSALISNKLSKSFERLYDLDGEWAMESFGRNWPLIGGREISRLKTELAIMDGIKINRSAKAVNVFLAIMDAGQEINKSSMALCQKILTKMLDEAYEE